MKTSTSSQKNCDECGDFTFRPKTHARSRPIHDPNKIISSETFVLKSVKIGRLFGQFVRVLFYRHDFFLRLCLAVLIFFCNPRMNEKKRLPALRSTTPAKYPPLTKAYSRPAVSMPRRIWRRDPYTTCTSDQWSLPSTVP